MGGHVRLAAGTPCRHHDLRPGPLLQPRSSRLRSTVMARVGVLVPWRDGCPHRERALGWVLDRYASAHPGWDVVIGTAPTGAWIKAAAVADALARTDATILVVADADVWTPGLDTAVSAVLDGRPWVVPHRRVWRLTPEATSVLIAGGDVTPSDLVERPYTGVRGGGITVLRRDVYEDVPMDPRFVGWGQEDESWGYALGTLYGPVFRPDAPPPLMHLWHPPQERMSRSVGSNAGAHLKARYSRARSSRQRMTTIVREARDVARSLAQPAGDDHPAHA